MVRRRRKGRPLKGFAESSSSSDEEDAFSAISKNSHSKRARPPFPQGGSIDSERPNTVSAFSPEHNLRKDTGNRAAETGGYNDSDINNIAKNDEPNVSSFISPSETSSTKRHHHVNAARQAKMDALLQELQSTTPSDPSTAIGSAMNGAEDPYGSSVLDGASYYGPGGPGTLYNHPPPMKMGSYVEPGQEHLTTNIFVGNLDPTTTEEELTDAFRQFGDLYSVKIMWPRTAEERARNRNTGFVCFMTRADAQDAMDAYQDADPLDTGRRLVLRWGKNVKKTVKFGTGGVPTNLRKKPREDDSRKGKDSIGQHNAKEEEWRQPSKLLKDKKVEVSDLVSGQDNERDFTHNVSSAKEISASGEPVTKSPLQGPSSSLKPMLGPMYEPEKHSTEAITVTAPKDLRRLKFITTVASFVAKDGSILEHKLIEAQSSNPDFQFLLPRDEVTCLNKSNSAATDDKKANDEKRLTEHIFYRWRVYAFAQGDGVNSWNTDPFVMIEPHGRFWIPPPLNLEAAQQEEEAEKRREQVILAAQEERRRLAEKKDFMTGRQLEHAKFSIGLPSVEKGGGIKLNEWEKEKFHELFKKKLCSSQESICEAMAFAFDKSGAAKEISGLMKEALLESDNGISADTRIARLYLMSDILFNSQQPGVRNAFQYRDAIESMSPEVFESLGHHGNGKAGRMTMNKLRKAVSSVLSAWTNWSVYNSTFIDELQSRFEGKELTTRSVATEEEQEDREKLDAVLHPEEEDNKEEHSLISTVPRGEWTYSVENDGLDVDGEALEAVDGDPLEGADAEEVDDVDGEIIDDDIDGDILTEDD